MASRFSFPVARIARIPIRVHFLLPAVAVYAVLTTPGYTRWETLLALLSFFGVMAVSVLLHELGHAFAGRRHGLRVEGILLWPLGGLCMLLDRPRFPRHALHVALAGVSVSVLLGLAAGAAMWIRDGAPPGFPRLAHGTDFLRTAWDLNLALALFNLLPGLPLDGGAALEALLWRRLGRPRARLVVLVSGAVIGVGLLVGGIADDQILMTALGGWTLHEVWSMYQVLRETGLEEEALFGVHDFSEGHTSLEASAPPPDREERKRAKAAEKARRGEERRTSVAVKESEDAAARLDRLLDRIAAEGIASLSAEEREFLDAESRRLRGRKGR